MKKIFLALIGLVAFINISNAQNDTMYVMKNGAVVGKYDVNNQVDSVIFYQPAITPGNTFTDPRDGTVYQIVTIGTQVWMAENLKATHFNDGSPIPNVTGNAAWQSSGAAGNGAYCNYDNDIANVATYGRLYNWYAVDAGNLAPVGWHVPTQDDWLILVNYLGGNTVAGGKMKEAGLAHWSSPNIDATNESGFTALPGGSRYYDGGFSQIGTVGFFWSSTEHDIALAKFWRMTYQFGIIYNENHYKANAYSVRCVKD